MGGRERGGRGGERRGREAGGGWGGRERGREGETGEEERERDSVEKFLSSFTARTRKLTENTASQKLPKQSNYLTF